LNYRKQYIAVDKTFFKALHVIYGILFYRLHGTQLSQITGLKTKLISDF